jgi:hypothetical protein
MYGLIVSARVSIDVAKGFIYIYYCAVQLSCVPAL